MSRMLSRRDPFAVWPSFERMFSTMLGDPLLAIEDGLEEGTLPLDVSEDEKDVIVRASLPGFHREDIDIELNEGVLTIKAERSEEHEEKGEKFYRKERRFGSVSRRVALPSSVEEDKADAQLDEGVLTLRIPKSKKATPKRVSIK